MLDMVHTYSTANKYIVHTDEKSSTTVFPSSMSGVPLSCPSFGPAQIAITSSFAHLGIYRDNLSSNNSTLILKRISTLRKTSYLTLGNVLTFKVQLHPSVSINILNSYVLPATLSGLESIVLSNNDMTSLNSAHYQKLRQLLFLPKYVLKSAVYLISGTYPIEYYLHCRVIKLFSMVISDSSSLMRELSLRQLAVKSYQSNSWFIYVTKLFSKYSLPPPIYWWKVPENIPSLLREAKVTIASFWFKHHFDNALGRPSVSNLDFREVLQGKLHPIWSLCPLDHVNVNGASIQMQIVLGVFPLQALFAKFGKSSPICRICGSGPEDLSHFLAECPSLQTYYSNLYTIMDRLSLISPHPFVHTHPLLWLFYEDSTTGHMLNSAQMKLLQFISRRFLFYISSRRRALLRGRH